MPKDRRNFNISKKVITNLKNEAQSLAQQQAEAWTKIQENPNSDDAEQLRILYQQLEERKKQMEAEAQQAGIILGMMKDKNLEQKGKEIPRNFQDLYDEMEDEQASFITANSEIKIK